MGVPAVGRAVLLILPKNRRFKYEFSLKHGKFDLFCVSLCKTMLYEYMLRSRIVAPDKNYRLYFN